VQRINDAMSLGAHTFFNLVPNWATPHRVPSSRYRPGADSASASTLSMLADSGSHHLMGAE
jgi:hypothetical protein